MLSPSGRSCMLLNLVQESALLATFNKIKNQRKHPLIVISQLLFKHLSNFHLWMWEWKLSRKCKEVSFFGNFESLLCYQIPSSWLHTWILLGLWLLNHFIIFKHEFLAQQCSIPKLNIDFQDMALSFELSPTPVLHWVYQLDTKVASKNITKLSIR